MTSNIMATRKRKPKDVGFKARLLGAFRSKTVIFGLIVAALSALQGFVLVIPIDPLQQALIGFALSVIIIVLRFVTKVPLDDK